MLFLNEKKIVKEYKAATRCMSARAEHEPDGGYWITDGYTGICVNTPDDWRTIGGAIFGEAAGDWLRDKNGVYENKGSTLAQTLHDAVKEAGTPAEVAPMLLDIGEKKKARVLYDAKHDIAVMVNAAYLEFFNDVTFRVTSEVKPVVVMFGDTPVGIIMPIKPKVEAVAAVRAYYGKANAAIHDDPDKLRAAIRGYAAELDAAKALVAEYHKQIEDLKKQLADKPAPVACDIAAEAEAAAVKFRNIGGKITATVKGANTTAPVVWIGGEVAQKAAELEAAGAVWSNKRGAWYYRVTARA